MKCIGDNILVEYAENKLLKDFGNGFKIHLPERSKFDVVDGSEYTSRITDRKLVNPQLAIVKAENPNYPFKTGDMIYLHYGAYELRYPYQDNQFFVNANMVFFTCNEGVIKPVKGIHIGELIIHEAPKTASGIYTTSDAHVREACVVKILHAAENNLGIQDGDEVYTVDDHQDTFEFNNRKYVRLSERYITMKKEAV